VLTARDGIRGLLDSFYVVNCLLIYNRLRRNSYRMMVKFPVMVDVARGSRLGVWLRACCLFIMPSKSRGGIQNLAIPQVSKELFDPIEA
ncbi:hypothetical protein Tco_1539186, partial [Tanacetum coccineum]